MVLAQNNSAHIIYGQTEDASEFCWDCQTDLEDLFELLNVDIEANVDDCQSMWKMFCMLRRASGRGKKMSLVECFNKCPPVSDEDCLDVKRTRDHVSLLNYAAYKVFAIEALGLSFLHCFVFMSMMLFEFRS